MSKNLDFDPKLGLQNMVKKSIFGRKSNFSPYFWHLKIQNLFFFKGQKNEIDYFTTFK